MRRFLISIFFVLLSGAIALLRAEEFKFAVRHHHTLKDCRGTVRITPDGVEYSTSHTKDTRQWRFDEIRTLKIESPTEISIVTYEDQKRFAGKDRVFRFTLLDGKATGGMSAFLLSQVKKPMVLAVIPEKANPAFEIPVKHLHVLGGSLGLLRIYSDRVTFQTEEKGDSRVWRITDIERFNQPDRFRFQIVSYVPRAGGPTEVYNFQLLEDLPENAYDYLCIRVHPSSYYPAAH